MQRIAILADVHANPYALARVVDDLDGLGPIDEVIVAGDMVGRGPCGAEVIDMVRARPWRVIGGNHEEYLINFWRRNVPDEWLVSQAWGASRWMAEELGEERVCYIEALPFSLRSEIDPSILVVHGTTRSNQEGIGTWTADERLRELAHDLDDGVSMLVCAHTHRPLDRVEGGVRFVNVGSVGAAV